jgi:pyruvate/2-oxoglutarate dehydrogenase complex dihydrolipoamide dehydrogenase (E3) component
VIHFYRVLNNRGIIALKSTVEELAHTVYPHPTLSGVVMEAALGQAIHI